MESLGWVGIQSATVRKSNNRFVDGKQFCWSTNLPRIAQQAVHYWDNHRQGFAGPGKLYLPRTQTRFSQPSRIRDRIWISYPVFDIKQQRKRLGCWRIFNRRFAVYIVQLFWVNPWPWWHVQPEIVQCFSDLGRLLESSRLLSKCNQLDQQRQNRQRQNNQTWSKTATIKASLFDSRKETRPRY